MTAPVHPVLVVLLTLLAPAAQAGPGTARGAMTEPADQLFVTYERDLALSVARRDRAAVDNLLADGFRMQTAGRPVGEAVGRGPWIARALARQAQPFAIDHLRVHRSGNTATVSFVQIRDPVAAPRARYVVDTWTRAHGPWKLLRRDTRPAPRQPSGR